MAVCQIQRAGRGERGFPYKLCIRGLAWFALRRGPPVERCDGMIRDNAVAKDALSLMETANALLTKSLAPVREKSTPEEYKDFQAAMAQVLGRLFFLVMEPIYRQHPSLAPADTPNISPSTGSGETFLDFQPLSARRCSRFCFFLRGSWGLVLFHLSSFIFVSSDDADRFLKLASPAVVRCQPWIYLRLVA